MVFGKYESQYTIVRTFVATDECGNEATAQQLITVQDTQAPVLSGAPENITFDCEGEIAAAEFLNATDICDEVVEVVFTQSGFEQENPEGARAFCQLTTPVNMNPAWALIIFDMPNGADEYLTQSVTFTEYPGDENGLKGHLAGTVVSSTNPNAGWIIDVWFNQGVDWTAWDSKPWPTSYKDDQGLAGDNYLNWIYYIMVAGQATLTGWGDYEGSLLNLLHAPSNLYYAYQAAIAANNFNSEYGHGAWF